MSVDQYVVKEIPTSISELLPCFNDGLKLAWDFKLQPEEREQAKIILANVGAFLVGQVVELLPDGPNVIGDAPTADTPVTPEQIKAELEALSIQTRAVEAAPEAGFNPLVLVSLAQLAWKIYQLLKNK